MGANDPEHQVPVGNEEPQCIGRLMRELYFAVLLKILCLMLNRSLQVSSFMYPIGKVEDTDHLAVREAAGNFQQVVPFPLQGNGA